jgi:outer membrane beta-barrel protein
MHRWFGGLLAATAVIAASAPSLAYAQDNGSLVVIQQRKFRLFSELEIGANFTPLDAFTKGIGLELAYTIHFNDDLGWEIFRGGYQWGVDTGLRQQLSTEFGVAPTQFPTLQYYGSTALLWSPFYGKLASANSQIAHVAIFFTAGAAASHWTGSTSTNEFYFGPELGVGFRAFLSHYWSWRLEVRDAYFVNQPSPEVLMLMTGFSLNFGGSN